MKMEAQKTSSHETDVFMNEAEKGYKKGGKEREERPLQIPNSKTVLPEPPHYPSRNIFSGGSELGSLQQDSRDKINEMLHENNFPGIRFRKAKEFEYTVDFEELALSISQLLSEIFKREKIIQELKSEKNTVVQEFSGYKERHEYSLKQKARDLEEIIAIKEKELSLCYSNINDLRFQLEDKQSGHSAFSIPRLSTQAEIEQRLEILLADNEKLFKDNQTLTFSLNEARRANEELQLSQRSPRVSDSRFSTEDPSLKEQLEILKIKCAKLEDNNLKLSRDLYFLKESRNFSKESSLSYKPQAHQSFSYRLSTEGSTLEQVKLILNVKTDKELIQVANHTDDLLRAISRMEAFIKEVCLIVQNIEKLEMRSEKDLGQIIDISLPILKKWAQDREEYKRLLSFRSELVSLLYKTPSHRLSERDVINLLEEIKRLLLPKS